MSLKYYFHSSFNYLVSHTSHRDKSPSNTDIFCTYSRYKHNRGCQIYEATVYGKYKKFIYNIHGGPNVRDVHFQKSH